MLKKIMKAALAVSLVFGMTSMAMAEMKVGASMREYMGQYNSGADDYSSHWKNIGESNINFTGSAGKMSGFFQYERRTGDLEYVQRRLDFNAGPVTVRLGTNVNIGTVPLANSQWGSSSVPNSQNIALYWSGYNEADGVEVSIPIEGVGFIEVSLYSNGQSYTSKKALGISGDTVTSSGTVTQVGANLTFSGITVRAGYSSDKTDDPADPDDEALTSTAMLLGVKAPIGDMLTIAGDYVSTKSSYDTWSEDLKVTVMDLSVDVKAGPGTLTANIDTETAKAGDKIYDRTATSVLYKYPVDKAASINFGYIASTKKPEGGDSVTTTYTAAGFQASF